MPETFYAPHYKALRPNMVLAVIRMNPMSIENFRIEFINTYRLPTGFAEKLALLQRSQTFKDFPDQKYLRDVMVPACTDALERQRVAMASITANILNMRVSYDRVIFPQRAVGGRSEWCVVLLDIKLLLPAISKAGTTDGHDLGILQLLTEGASTREIATAMSLSPRTIEHRLERLKSGFGARNLTHLVALTVSRGMLSSAAQSNTPFLDGEKPEERAVPNEEK